MRESAAEGREMRRRIEGSGFLQNEELNLLAAQYEVNILAATGESNSFQPITAQTLKELLLPPRCCNWRDGLERFDTTICVYTNGSHF
jgi:hypothetical protein